VSRERKREGGREGGWSRTRRDQQETWDNAGKEEKKERTGPSQPPERGPTERERMHDGNRAQKWGKKDTVEGERKKQERTHTHYFCLNKKYTPEKCKRK
jgi:hypothetical protein